MAATYPGGGSNTYVPSHEASGKYTVEYSRNPDSFKLNQYIQIVPVDKDVGLYLEMLAEEAGRVVDSTGNDHVWPYGVPASDANSNTEGFEFKAYRTRRRMFGFNIPWEPAQQASWDVVAQNGRVKAQQAMTLRTQRVITMLTTSGNFPATNTIASGSITGVTGKLDASTSARMDIKRTFDHAKEAIMVQTLGAVSMDDIVAVVSPVDARKMAVTQEIVDYIKGSPDALGYVKGQLGPNAHYGLPERLYGTKVVVEDAVKTTSKKGATVAKSFVYAGDSLVFVARPGGLIANVSPQTPRFAAATLFMYEEMTVEEEHARKEWDRLIRARVVENYAEVLTSGIAAFLVTDTMT